MSHPLRLLHVTVIIGLLSGMPVRSMARGGSSQFPGLTFHPSRGLTLSTVPAKKGGYQSKRNIAANQMTEEIFSTRIRGLLGWLDRVRSAKFPGGSIKEQPGIDEIHSTDNFRSVRICAAFLSSLNLPSLW